MFDPKIIMSKIDEIRKITDNLDEPYKTESFKILFSIALKKEDPIISMTSNASEEITQDVLKNEVNDPMKKLASQCKITVEQLQDVLHYENEQFILLKKITG